MELLRRGIGWLLLGIVLLLIARPIVASSASDHGGGYVLGLLLGLIGLGLAIRGLVMVLWFLLRPAKRDA